MNIPLNKKMATAGIAALLTASLMVWLWGSTPQAEPIMTAAATQQDFKVVVDSVGDLDASQAIELSSELSGDKGKIIYLVKEGKRVSKGEVLVRMDPSPFEQDVYSLQNKANEYKNLIDAMRQLLAWEESQLEREVTKAQYEYNIAKLDLRKLEKGDGPQNIAELEGKFRKLKQEYSEKEDYLKALKKLAGRGFANPTEIKIAQQKVVETKLAYKAAERQLNSYKVHVLPILIEKAKAKVNSCKIALEQLKKSGGFKIGKARASLNKARQDHVSTLAALKRAQQELDKTVIKAPMPGMVVLREAMHASVNRKPRVGDKVWHNMPLLYLPNIDRMHVNTRVREVDLHKVKVGMPASVSVDAYPDLRLSGKVSSIGVLATSRPELMEQEKHFQVMVSVETRDQRLRPGMTARVSIKCSDVKNALTVPVQAVFNEGGRKFCYIDIKSSFEKREVKTGKHNDDLVAIVEGMQPAEEVALSLPPKEEVRRTRTLQPRPVK